MRKKQKQVVQYYTINWQQMIVECFYQSMFE